MYDLHGHYLPGLDDGARSWEDALAMARMAVEDGIKGVVCTPHWVRGSLENGREAILERVERFKQRLQEELIPLQVFPGAELRLDADLPRRIETGEVLTINDGDRYLLLELPPEMIPRDLERFFWTLQTQNLQIIIGHPERHPVLMKDPERLYDWVEMGIMTQITGASLLGRFGTTVQRFTVRLLEHRLVTVIASDAHGLKTRAPKLAEAYREAETIAGSEAARHMVRDFPKRIIQGETVAARDPIPLTRRRATASFWRKPLSLFKVMLSRG